MVKFNEIANLFPMMVGNDYEELKKDIANNGLLEPAVLFNGEILDGRNRYTACIDLGIEPLYLQYEGDNPLQYVISKNLHRRHLNESQRAVTASMIANMKVGGDRRSNHSANLQNDIVSQSEAASMLNVSPRLVAMVKAIEKAAPEYIDRMMSGAMTANEAQKEIKKEIRDKEIETKRLQFNANNISKNLLLYKGDMLDVIKNLGKFELILTDPPYGVTNYEWDILNTKEWLEAIQGHLANEYNLFWFCSPKYMADIEIDMRSMGFKVQSRIVWHRRNMAMGSKSEYKFIDTWEMILHVGNRKLNFPSEWSESWFDVQEFAVPQTNFNDTKVHPFQKPEALIRRLVEYGSYPGDNILDPFAGSGTVGFVTPNDRICTMIEMDEEYTKTAELRLGINRHG